MSYDLEELLIRVFWCVLLAVGVAAATLLLVAAAKEKRVDGYYLSQGSGGKRVSTCIYAHWTWHPDEVAFCTNNVQEAIDALPKLNATVRK